MEREKDRDGENRLTFPCKMILVATKTFSTREYPGIYDKKKISIMSSLFFFLGFFFFRLGLAG